MISNFINSFIVRLVLLITHRALQKSSNLPSDKHVQWLLESVFLNSSTSSLIAGPLGRLADLLSLRVGSLMDELILNICHLILDRIPDLLFDIETTGFELLTSNFINFNKRFSEAVTAIDHHQDEDDSTSAASRKPSFEKALLCLIDVLSVCAESSAILLGFIDILKSCWIENDGMGGVIGWNEILHSITLDRYDKLSNFHSSSSSSSTGGSSVSQKIRVYRLIEACQKSFVLCTSLPISFDLSQTPTPFHDLCSAVQLSQQRCRRLSLQALCAFAFLPATLQMSDCFERLTEWMIALVEEAVGREPVATVNGGSKKSVKINKKGLGIATKRPGVRQALLPVRSQSKPIPFVIASDFYSLGILDIMQTWKDWIHPSQIEFLSFVICPEEYRSQLSASVKMNVASSLVMSQRLLPDSVDLTPLDDGVLTDEELNAIQRIQEVLDGLAFGDGFILKCYRQMNRNVEKVS